MSPKQWQRVADELALPWGRAALRCDGYVLTLQVVPISPLRYAIEVYVDGWIKGAWLDTDCEERRRFMRPVNVHLFSPAERRRMLAGIRRPTKELRELADKRMTLYQSRWKSFRALQRHLVANNQVIEPVSLGEALKEAA